MNNLALDNCYNKLMKVRMNKIETTCIKPYLEFFESINIKAYFLNNENFKTLPQLFSE